MKNLHIHGQAYEHDNVYIIGDREALEMLHQAIGYAIKAAEAGVDAVTTATVFCADGEGYVVEVRLREGEEYWDNALRPYTSECSQDMRTGTDTPNIKLPWRD